MLLCIQTNNPNDISLSICKSFTLDINHRSPNWAQYYILFSILYLMCASEILQTNRCSSVLPTLYQHSKIQDSSVIFQGISYFASHSVFITNLQPYVYIKNIIDFPRYKWKRGYALSIFILSSFKISGGPRNKNELNSQETRRNRNILLLWKQL